MCLYVCVCVCINCACTFLCVGVKRYGREVSNACLTKKENCRNCMLVEISSRHF